MSWLINTLMIGVAVAFATTFDDNLYLTAFFGKVNRTFRPKHVVLGEYLGFTALVFVSLVGFFGGLLVPQAWIGLLGLLPIAIGLINLFNRETEELNVQAVSLKFPRATQFKRPQQQTVWETIRDPQTYRVSAVTVANGGNNIGIYVPLFASCNLPSLSIIVAVCYLTIGMWLFLSYHLTGHPLVAPLLARYGRKIFPFVLIWLGFFILIKSESYQLLPSVALFSQSG